MKIVVTYTIKFIIVFFTLCFIAPVNEYVHINCEDSSFYMDLDDCGDTENDIEDSEFESIKYVHDSKNYILLQPSTITYNKVQSTNVLNYKDLYLEFSTPPPEQKA